LGELRSVSVQGMPELYELWTLTEEVRERLRAIRRERLEIKRKLEGDGFWIDKTYVLRGARRYGPYYRLRWLGPDGKKHAKYLGKDPTIALPDSHVERLIKGLERLDFEEERLLSAVTDAVEALRRGLGYVPTPEPHANPHGRDEEGAGFLRHKSHEKCVKHKSQIFFGRRPRNATN